MINDIVQDVRDLHFPYMPVAAPSCQSPARDSFYVLPWLCTRATGHSGRHAAHAKAEVVVVWGSK